MKRQKPSNTAPRVAERVRKCRRKKRQIALIQANEEMGITTDRRGVCCRKLLEILDKPPNGSGRNNFIKENTEIITLVPYTNVDRTTGAKHGGVRNQVVNDRYRVQHIIRLNLATGTERPRFADQLVVKRSNIKNAGMGIFTARPLKKGEKFAVYAGTYHTGRGFRSEYYMYNEKQGYGLNACPSVGKHPKPLYMGMHLANDIHLGLILGDHPDYGAYKSLRLSPEYNAWVNEDFLFVAKRDMKAGEEIYYHYGWSGNDTPGEELEGLDDDNGNDSYSDSGGDCNDDDHSYRPSSDEDDEGNNYDGDNNNVAKRARKHN